METYKPRWDKIIAGVGRKYWISQASVVLEWSIMWAYEWQCSSTAIHQGNCVTSCFNFSTPTSQRYILKFSIKKRIDGCSYISPADGNPVSQQVFHNMFLQGFHNRSMKGFCPTLEGVLSFYWLCIAETLTNASRIKQGFVLRTTQMV